MYKLGQHYVRLEDVRVVTEVGGSFFVTLSDFEGRIRISKEAAEPLFVALEIEENIKIVEDHDKGAFRRAILKHLDVPGY